jgi:hypothetical protein
MPHNGLMTILFAVGWLGKVIILVLESKEKRALLKKPFEGSSLEATSGVFNRSLFWWLNGLLWKGSKTTLTVETLPDLDDDIKHASNPQDLIEKWKTGKLAACKLVERRDERLTMSSRQVQIQCIAVDLRFSLQMAIHGRHSASSWLYLFHFCAAISS